MNIKHIDRNGNNLPVMVFKSQTKTGRVIYQIGVSRKDPEGKYINGYILAQFNKDVELQNKEKITLDNAILGFYIDKDKNTVPFIRVFDYSSYNNVDEFSTIEDFDDGDLPF